MGTRNDASKAKILVLWLVVRKKQHNNKSAFTLIELSIVLVIIGLIVGGVLTGRDLIKAAEIRKGVTELEQMATAVKTFELKYNCVPGDCANSSNLFGNDPVYDGNGNGFIEGMVEQEMSVRTLITAGLIKGDPIGIVFGSNGSWVSIYNGVGYGALYEKICEDSDGAGCDWATYAQTNGLVYIWETACPSNNYLSCGGVSSYDAQRIDTKIDDGLPQTGKFIAINSQPCLNGGLPGLNSYIANQNDTSNCKTAYYIEK